MNALEIRSSFDSTAAAGGMLARPTVGPALVGLMLAGVGTSSALGLPADAGWQSAYAFEQTTAGAPIVAQDAAGTALAELRRLSGLTWDQLARMFGVSRRALHFWASGRPMARTNEEHLQRVIAVLRMIDRGTASANRAALLAASEDGRLPLDLLVDGDYDRVLSLLGRGEGRSRVSPKHPTNLRESRTRRSPDELVEAMQDPIHPASGRLLGAKAIATTRRR